MKRVSMRKPLAAILLVVMVVVSTVLSFSITTKADDEPGIKAHISTARGVATEDSPAVTTVRPDYYGGGGRIIHILSISDMKIWSRGNNTI